MLDELFKLSVTPYVFPCMSRFVFGIIGVPSMFTVGTLGSLESNELNEEKMLKIPIFISNG